MKIKFVEQLFGKNKVNAIKKIKNRRKIFLKPRIKRTFGINSINLRTKLYISFAMLTACMVVSSAVGIINIRKINVQSNSLYQRNLKGINLLHSIREDIFLDVNEANELVKFVSDNGIKQLEDRTKEIDNLIGQFKTVADTKVNKDLLKQLEVDYKSYQSMKHDFLDYCKKNNDNLGVFADMLKKSGNTVDTVLEGLIKYNNHQAELANNSNAEVYSRAIKLSAIILILAFIISMLISIIISTNLAAEVKKILAFTNSLKNKDLSVDMEVNGSDELSKISRALIETKESIKDIIGNITDMAQDIGASSEEFSASIEEITLKMDKVNSSAETIVKGAEHLSALTQEATSSTLESNRAINNLSEKSQSGDKVSNDIKKRAIEIKEKINESLRASDELYKMNQSKIIDAINEGKIVNEVKVMADTIGQIAEQTNLLSLNAAIEAARAGEHGRGFAVVADEVRKLAVQSSKTVTLIQSIVVRVQNAFNNLSRTADDMLKYMKDNIRPDYIYFVYASNQYFGDAELISNISNEIANSAVEMSAATEQIGGAMQNVSATTLEDLRNSESISYSISEVAGALEEISKAAENQARMSEEISRIIGEFKLS